MLQDNDHSERTFVCPNHTSSTKPSWARQPQLGATIQSKQCASLRQNSTQMLVALASVGIALVCRCSLLVPSLIASTRATRRDLTHNNFRRS